MWPGCALTKLSLSGKTDTSYSTEQCGKSCQKPGCCEHPQENVLNRGTLFEMLPGLTCPQLHMQSLSSLSRAVLSVAHGAVEVLQARSGSWPGQTTFLMTLGYRLPFSLCRHCHG